MSDAKWAHLAGPDKLRHWRTKIVDITQQEAADMIGVDLASYNAFEKGRERPGLDYAVSIERVTKGKVAPHHWTDERAKDSRARAS